MFYAHFVLAKKGPLARIWLAAHWDKKLTKAHVFETNIEKSVEGILQPKVKMALRTSGHLLLGVVRIYSRKAKYLLADCNEAFVKIKMAFRPGVVDLPETNREAAVNAITLPEVFHNFDTAVPVQENVLDTAEFIHHQTRAEEITMREDYGSLNMDSATAGNDAFMSDLIMTPLDTLDTEEDPSKHPSGTLFDEDEDEPHDKNDKNDKNDMNDMNDIVLFPTNDESDVQRGGLYDDDDDDEDNSHLRDLPADDHPPPSPLMSSREPTPTPSIDPPEKSLSHVASPTPDEPSLLREEEAEAAAPSHEEPQKEVSLPVSTTAAVDQTTLIRDEEESFALAPVDASAIRGTVRTKRKRKLIVDEVKAIAGEEMKAQLSDTADIVTTLDLAPPTKRLMHWKETGGVEKLFALPGRPLHDTAMFKFYQSQLTARPSDNEEFGLLGDSENIMLENVPGAAARPDSPFEPAPTPRRAPRKRKTVNEESPSKRAQREEDEAAALAQAEAYRREQQAMMNNSDMYDTTHLLQKQREEEEAAASSQDQWQEDLNATKDSEEGLNTSEEQVMKSSEAPPINAEAQPPENQFDNLGYNGATSDPNMSWDAMNGEVDAGSPGAPSMGAPTPHHDVSDDDYVDPMSVAPNPEEEMGEEETIEEFEDRVLNKRALQLSNILKNKFESKEVVVFNTICRGNVRKQAAQKFYSMLVLQKVMALEVSQPGSCGDISITKGPKFDTAVF